MAASIALGDVQRITSETEKKYGLPEGTLFKIGNIESSFQDGQVSPKGAKGYFQFTDDTARRYGLDDPFDFEKSSDAAGRYMRDNLAKYQGNMDLSLADYNGGPKAAKALAKGKPWAETSDYLAKFYGNKSEPLSQQFTTGSEVPLTASPSASQLYRDARQQESEYGGVGNNILNLPRAIGLGFQVDNSVYNFWQERGLSSVDPDFRWDDDFSKQMLDGVPERHWGYLLQSKSKQEAELRRARLLDTMEKEVELSKMGVAGFGGRLVGNLVDLPTLISFVPGFGGAGLLTTTSRIANAARMAALGAATNVAFDAATMQFRPTATPDDLYISAAMGLGLGAAGGLSVNPARLAAQRLAAENRRLGEFGLRESGKAQIKELGDNGFNFGAGREEFARRIQGKPDEPVEIKYPGGAIVLPRGDGEPPKIFHPGDPPEVRKPGNINEPLPPEATPATPPATGPVAPKAPPAEAPKGKGWTSEWDTPRYASGGGNEQLLVLPPAKRVSQLAEYVRQFSKNGDIVKVMDRVLKGIDLRKLEFKVIEKGQRFGQRDMDNAILGTKGAVGTPRGSIGDNIMMFLRGHSWEMPGVNPMHTVGLNEETFVHELVHVATVYKLRGVEPGIGVRITDPVVRKAADDLANLHGDILDHARQTFGANWKGELQGRLGANLENEKELIAYGLTNRNFQEWLKTVPVEGGPEKNLWDRFVHSLRKLLGIGPKEHNAFTRLIELSAPLTKKGDFVERIKTNPELEATGGFVDADTVKAANEADLAPVYGWGLGLENRLGGAKAPPAVRQLASKLFGTTIGYKDNAVVKLNAWDDTTKWADSWAVEMRKGTYPQFEEWLKGSQYKWHEKGKAFDDFGAQVSNYIRGFEGDYPPQVVKAGEHMRKTLANVVDYINSPLKDEGRAKIGLTETDIRDPETGKVERVGTLEKNPNYLPRKHDINKWNSMVSNFGRDAVEGWWARAYQAGREGISDEAAAKWAKWYVRTVEEAHANRTQDMLDDLLKGTDRDALKNSLMLNGGYSEAEALRIMDDMIPGRATDAGRTMASLKHRNTIRETHTEQWTTKDGTKMEVSLNDFIHSNAFDVVEPYLRRTAGSVALAKHLDIYKMGDIDRVIAEATGNKLGQEFKSIPDIQKLRKDLKFAFERVQGLPQEEFSTLNKGLEMWRNFNVIRLMGGAVWNQASELSQIIGTMGWKTTLAALPELRALRRDIATGKAPHDILDHLENTIGGVGSDYVARLEFKAGDDWVRNKGDTRFNRWLDSADTGTRKLAKGVLDYTGMTPLMIQQKRVHAIALVNHFVNVANGKAAGFLTKDRLAWMGMSEDDFGKVLSGIKQFTKPADGEFSKTFKMDFAGWQKADPESYSKFMTAIHRESRRVIQENDLGSMIPLMGTTLGKTVFQFMNFSMHGWNKSLMFAMNHRDWSTLSTVLHGSLFASIAYMGRTLLGAGGMEADKRQQYLDKRMSVGQIVTNSFGRISQASVLPNMFDTISPYPLFSGMRTTSDLSNLASNPTYQAINGLLSMKKLIRNGVSDEYQTTEKDIRTWGRLLPLNNVFPVTTFLNHLANDYPHNEKQQ